MFELEFHTKYFDLRFKVTSDTTQIICYILFALYDLMLKYRPPL